MRFRYVFYGDIYTVENEDKGLAMQEAERKVEEITKQLPNATLDSLDLLSDLLNGITKRGNMICQNCQKSVGSLVQVKDVLGIIIGVCEECSVHFKLVV